MRIAPPGKALVSDGEVIAELGRQVRAGGLPRPSADGAGNSNTVCNGISQPLELADGVRYTVQQFWSNADDACTAGGAVTTPPAVAAASSPAQPAAAEPVTPAAAVQLPAAALLSTGASQAEARSAGIENAVAERPEPVGDLTAEQGTPAPASEAAPAADSAPAAEAAPASQPAAPADPVPAGN